jgi:hypothetical protein
MVMSQKGLGHEKDYAGKRQKHIQKNRPVISSERASQKNKTVLVKE